MRLSGLEGDKRTDDLGARIKDRPIFPGHLSLSAARQKVSIIVSLLKVDITDIAHNLRTLIPEHDSAPYFR
jgi:hypothetical protein